MVLLLNLLVYIDAPCTCFLTHLNMYSLFYYFCLFLKRLNFKKNIHYQSITFYIDVSSHPMYHVTDLKLQICHEIQINDLGHAYTKFSCCKMQDASLVPNFAKLTCKYSFQHWFTITYFRRCHQNMSPEKLFTL